MPQGLIDFAANRICTLAQQHTDVTVLPATRLWGGVPAFRFVQPERGLQQLAPRRRSGRP
eukprot:10299276-Lingulodinium_polyedra.AAC.1